MGRAEAFAQRHGAPAAYDSLDELVKDPRVDVVFIASPNHLHAPYTKVAARAGKHVLCEKPMALTAQDAADMIRVCRSRGVKLGLGFESVHHPAMKRARRLVEDGVVGAASLVQAQYGGGVRGVVAPPARSGGLNDWWSTPEMVGGASAMMALGVHAVNALRFILNQEVAEVTAMTDGHTGEQPLEALATLLLRFQGGPIGMVVCGRRTPDLKAGAVVYGSDGRIVLEGTTGQNIQGKLEVVSETVNSTEEYEYQELGTTIGEVEAFNRAVREDTEPCSSGLDGLRVVEVTTAMIESATTRKAARVESSAV
jgi:predicted dehydrogenase